ncbi:SDR family NAD(P)-dependent oxidoreductase [Chloroflexota bacterium]
MADYLKGKNAVVTGAGRGISREVALALAAEGARVVVNDPGVSMTGEGDEPVADEVVAQIKSEGGEAVANHDSVADYEGAGRMIQTCVDSFGRIDILINVAGILRDAISWKMTPEQWDDVVKVHLYGTFYTCRHAIPLMKKQKYGRIINTTSGAWKGTVGHANYGAAKGGVTSLTRALARELGAHGVTCNAISPGAATRMTMSEDIKQGFKKRLEAGLISQERYEEILDMPGPEYVPPMYVYLASDHSADINGTVFSCSGGKVAINSEPVEAIAIIKDYKKAGAWTMEELIKLVPQNLLANYKNPAPKKKE